VAKGDSKEVDLADLNPEFQRRLGNFLTSAKQAGLPAHIIEAYRSNAVQAQYYAEKQQGLRPYPVAPPGQSFHNYGYASDVLTDDRSRQQALINYANAHPEFGVSPLPGDAPHFQISGYKHVSDLLAHPPTLAEGNRADLSPFIAGNQGYTIAKGYTPGTTIAAANAPVAGALAKPEAGPESAGSTGSGGGAPGQPQDVRSIVYGKLTAAGLQPHQALGALWSLGGESGTGLNPGAYNPKDPGGAIGIGQWNGVRRTALENFAKARGTAVTDPNTQADFLVDELTNQKAATYQPGVFAKMQGADSAENAAKVWTTKFERPKIDNSAARIAQGQNVGSIDAQGNLALGKGSYGTGGGNTTAVASSTPATATTPAALPAQDAWYAALTKKPEGGGKSPMQAATEAFAQGPQKMKQAEEDQAPESVKNFTGTAPAARNVSPGLANVQQTYGQTLNSFSQPLTWNSAPPQAPQMPAAGLQPSAATQVPGTSLNSFQPYAQGLGYGINPVGYGFS
jgi:hypothetical protein